MPRDLSFRLHALTARLDRVADRILRAEYGLSYSRFLPLFMVGELGKTTQRSLAEQLGVTEPSISRMTGVLVEAGFIEAGAHRLRGNRRELRLTPAGRAIVRRACKLLETTFAELVDSSGVSYTRYLEETNRLLAALENHRLVPLVNGGSA